MRQNDMVTITNNRRVNNSRANNGRANNGRSVSRSRRTRAKAYRDSKIRVFIALTFILISIVLVVFASPSKASESKKTTVVYESVLVGSGDTLSSIAKEHNDISVCSNENYIEEVIRLNNILDNKICAGEYLVVPVYQY